jgi:hypothetical protein
MSLNEFRPQAAGAHCDALRMICRYGSCNSELQLTATGGRELCCFIEAHLTARFIHLVLFVVPEHVEICPGMADVER